VILTSARIGNPGPERSHYSFRMIPMGLLGAGITGHPHTTRSLINQLSCTGEHVEIKRSGLTRTRTQDPLFLGRTFQPLNHGSRCRVLFCLYLTKWCTNMIQVPISMVAASRKYSGSSLNGHLCQEDTLQNFPSKQYEMSVHLMNFSIESWKS
jgi:hypothetical protein